MKSKIQLKSRSRRDNAPRAMPRQGDPKPARRPHLKKPAWLRIRLRTGPSYRQLTSLVSSLSLHTVCQEARCPNIYECWNERTATLMILGETCTRRCGFCSVRSGLPDGLDHGEPRRVAAAVQQMGLRHAVITSVDRDDLPDGGAAHWAAVIRAIREKTPETRIEVLVPDFKGKTEALDVVLAAGPHIFAHNVETIPRLYRTVRPGSDYAHSLAVLNKAARKRMDRSVRIKSNLMLGLGETIAEVLAAMQEIRAQGVDILTIGQYLQPSSDQLPVQRYVHPDEFHDLAVKGRAMGYWHVESGPLVRSSYHASNHRPGGSSQ